MITREHLVLSISEAFELSPNLVSAKLVAMDKAVKAGQPGIHELLEINQRHGFEEELSKLIKGLFRYFDNLRVTKLVEAYALEVSKTTHMSPETVEAFILTDGQTDGEREALSKVFVTNLCFAAMKGRSVKTGQQ